MYQLSHSEDFLWDAQPFAIWSSVEPGIGITAVSLATLRPLFRSLRGNSTVSNEAKETGPRYTENPWLGLPKGARAELDQFPLNTSSAKHERFVTDEEQQLGDLAPTMGNSSRVEAGPPRPSSKQAVKDWWPTDGTVERPTGQRTMWLTDDSREGSESASLDEIAITRTIHVSNWPLKCNRTKV